MTTRQYARPASQLASCVTQWDDNQMKWREVCVTWRLPAKASVELAGDYYLWQVFAMCCLLWRTDMPVELLQYLRDNGQFLRLMRVPMCIPEEYRQWNRTGYKKYCTLEQAKALEVRWNYVAMNEYMRRFGTDIWYMVGTPVCRSYMLYPECVGEPYVEVKKVKVVKGNKNIILY